MRDVTTLHLHDKHFRVADQDLVFPHSVQSAEIGGLFDWAIRREAEVEIVVD